MTDNELRERIHEVIEISVLEGRADMTEAAIDRLILDLRPGGGRDD